MKSFSERYGYNQEKIIQYESLDSGTRVRLNNVVNEYLNSEYERRGILEYIGDEYFKMRRDCFDSSYYKAIEQCINESEWHEVLTFIEFFIQLFLRISEHDKAPKLIDKVNYILEYEKAGYRCLNDEIIPITNEEELHTLESTTSSKYSSVNIHMKKAISFYSNRSNPDYSNSIKESISAVESICCIIVGNDKAVLSSALDKLSKNGVKIHPSQIKAFKMLYGYTSDENGIRHAGIDFNGATEEDAKYMMISCSCFINYLIQKYEQII